MRKRHNKQTSNKPLTCNADFKTFTYTPIEPITIKKEEPKEEEKADEKVEDKVEEPAVTEHKDEVQDITFERKKPIIDDDDIPPFLRKLRR